MMKRQTIGILLFAATIGLSGCAAMCDGVISCEMGIRNKVLAQKAWGHWSWCYDRLDHPYHFASGFKAGYQDILAGGSGCQPTLPPQCYWKPTFQSPDGRCKINSWFDGFSHGALAAAQDGYSSMGEIPISPTARMNIEMANMPPDHQMFNPVGQSPTGGQVIMQGDPLHSAGPLVQPPPVPAESLEQGLPNAGPSLGTNGGTGTPLTTPNNVPVRPYE